MTHISKKKIEKEPKGLFDNALISIFTNLDKNSLNGTLSTLLTKTEIEMLRKRIGILLLTEHGLAQEQIAEATKTTRQTVSRIQSELALMNGKNKKIVLERMKSFRNKQAVKKIIKSILEVDISLTSTMKKISKL